MHKRSGPFWDAVEGRAPVPRAAATLGLELVDADVERGTIELAFAPTEAFTNPTGNVLGGFQAAMLLDTIGPALLATLEPDQFQSNAGDERQLPAAAAARSRDRESAHRAPKRRHGVPRGVSAGFPTEPSSRRRRRPRGSSLSTGLSPRLDRAGHARASAI